MNAAEPHSDLWVFKITMLKICDDQSSYDLQNYSEAIWSHDCKFFALDYENVIASAQKKVDFSAIVDFSLICTLPREEGKKTTKKDQNDPEQFHVFIPSV